MRTQCECGEQISTQRGQGTQHWKHIGSSSGPLVGRFSQLLSTSTAALNYLRLPWTWSGEVFHILILIQEWGVGGKKVEGNIAFISELILWRKPKLKHLSASQIKRFSSRLRLIGWIRPHSQSSQFAGAWPNPAFNLSVPSFFVSSECFYFPRQRGRWVMVWKDQPLGETSSEQWGWMAFEQ